MMHEAELEALRTMKDDMVKQKKKEILSQSSAKDKKNWFDTGSQGFWEQSRINAWEWQ